MDYTWRNLDEKWTVIIPNDSDTINSIKQFILHYYPNQFYKDIILDEYVKDNNTILKTVPFDIDEFNNKFPNIKVE